MGTGAVWCSEKDSARKTSCLCRLAGTPASLKNQKDGLLELQQARKIKKQPCRNSSKPEKSKRWPAGTPASLKNQKDGLLELQQAFAHRKRCSTLNTIIKKRTNLKARAIFL